MATPQTPQNFIAWMKGIESQLRLIWERLNNVLANTGLSVPSPGTTQVDGNLTVLGTFTAQGKISNGALVNPVAFDGNGGATTNFALSTTQTVVGSVSNTVPAGMTKMASFVVGNVSGFNSTATAGYLYAAVAITAHSTTYLGNELYTMVGVNEAREATGAKYGLLSGLTAGDVITHDVRARAAAAWPANASTRADLQVLILWGS